MTQRSRGSWPALALLALAFAGAFSWQRHRSEFLAIERDAEAAVAVAARHGLSLADVMALRDLVGVDAGTGRWEAAATAFASERQRLGDPLAAVSVGGDRGAAHAALAAAGDPERAWAAFRTDARAVPGLRFLMLRDRFRARERTRD